MPLFATRPALEPLLPEIAERQRAVLESGRYILGPEVEAFEAEFAAFVGRAALHRRRQRHRGADDRTAGARHPARGRGGRPGVTFFAPRRRCVNAGCPPVFADIDPATHCMTAATVEAAITGRTAR